MQDLFKGCKVLVAFETVGASKVTFQAGMYCWRRTWTRFLAGTISVGIAGSGLGVSAI
jgi:hypothetical protein